MTYIESDSFSPTYNLAFEQYVFDCLPTDEEYFMLWQNDNAIIIGKHQNTVEEINADFVRQNNITVVRRLSGGGAVYHDLGNINYTFIMHAGDTNTLNLSLFSQPLVRALAGIGVNAEISGRNDVTIDGRKISGVAQYIKNNRIMHHGTILFDSDLSVIGRALEVSRDKIESKGLKSVKSRVANVKEFLSAPMSVEEFKRILKGSMVDDANMRQYRLSAEDRERIRKLEAERYAAWEWNYGASPDYSIRKERRIEGVGSITLYMEVEGGRVSKYATRGDYFGSGDSSDIERALEGVPLSRAALKAALATLPIERYYTNATRDDLIDLILL